MNTTLSFRVQCLKNTALFGLLLCFFCVQAQDRSFATLPLIQANEIIVHSEGDLNHTAEYDHILKIYNNLVNARGDYRFPVPKLYLKDVEGYVASIDYQTFEITLEKKAYDICIKHGDAAIAFLLGHELTHYYEKHAWRSAFANENADLQIGTSLRSINDQIGNETEADYLGGFLAYTAGYGMFDKGGQIISDLYAGYGLGEELKGYPSKSDRIKLADRSAKKLGLLVDAFEMANLLLIAKRYKEAYAYYEYILNHYQSRELYNNLGTISVLSAMELFEKDSLKFKYVSELDVDFVSDRDPTDIKKRIENALDQAILHFNAAISLDPNYAPAYLNKANAYALKRDWVRAKFYLEQEALPIAQKMKDKFAKTLLDIEVLDGIISAKTGQSAAAEQKFSSAAGKGSKLGAANLNILKGNPMTRTARAVTDAETDDVGATNTRGYLRRPKFDQDKVVAVSDKYTFFQFVPTDSASIVFLTQDAHPNKKIRTAFVITHEKYEGSTKLGIKIGDSDDKLVETYGDPIKQFETTEGQFYLYDGIVFVIAANKVKKWANFSSTTYI